MTAKRPTVVALTPAFLQMSKIPTAHLLQHVGMGQNG